MASLSTLLRTNTKKIAIIIICLSLPVQIAITIGMVAEGAPFCYRGGQYTTEEDRNSFNPLYAENSFGTIDCTWEIGALFKLYYILPLTIVTLPIVLIVFSIYYAINRRRVRV